ncbi:unnamed protein product [Arabidopsis halleri]
MMILERLSGDDGDGDRGSRRLRNDDVALLLQRGCVFH